MQLRSYCRGTVVRAVDAATRERLFARLGADDMADLRSFLDPPKAKGNTIKGSGDVDYRLHKRNHTKFVLRPASPLHEMVSCVRVHHMCRLITYVIIYAVFYAIFLLLPYNMLYYVCLCIL